MARTAKTSNAPKRPLSSFILFGKDLRDTRADIKSLPIKEQASAIGKAWKEAAEDIRKRFNEEAARLKEEYIVKRKEYEQTDEYKDFKKVARGSKRNGGSKDKKPRNVGVSGYRLFISELSDTSALDEKDPEMIGKGHMAKCAVKWSRLNDREKNEYNERAKQLGKEGLKKDDDTETDSMESE